MPAFQRNDESGKIDIYCTSHIAPNGKPFKLPVSFDSTGIYVWCRLSRELEYIPFSQMDLQFIEHKHKHIENT
jgi:hypothetical protein